MSKVKKTNDIFVLFTSPKHLEAFQNFLSFTKQRQNRMFFLHVETIKIKHLQPFSTVKLPLVEFIHILTAFFHLPISLVLFTHSVIEQKWKNSLKSIFNCCALKLVFKKKTRLGNNFHFKDRIPKNLTSGVIY